MLKDKVQLFKTISLGECINQHDSVNHQHHSYIPVHTLFKRFIINAHHHAPSADHPERAKTFTPFQLAQNETLHRVVLKQLLRRLSSQNCQPIPFGDLQRLPVPNRFWEEVSMNIIISLHMSTYFNAILIVVNRLTKMQHRVPCKKTISTTNITCMYLNNVWKLLCISKPASHTEALS